MPQHLDLRFERDTDGTGELHVYVRRDKFSGAGSAWFSDRQIHEFGRSLSETFPVAASSKISLRGGYWKSEANPPQLEEVLVGITVYATNTTGTIGVRVELMEGRAEGVRTESRASVTVELLTDYESLRSFGHSVAALVYEQNTVAQLRGAA